MSAIEDVKKGRGQLGPKRWGGGTCTGRGTALGTRLESLTTNLSTLIIAIAVPEQRDAHLSLATHTLATSTARSGFFPRREARFRLGPG